MPKYHADCIDEEAFAAAEQVIWLTEWEAPVSGLYGVDGDRVVYVARPGREGHWLGEALAEKARRHYFFRND